MKTRKLTKLYKKTLDALKRGYAVQLLVTGECLFHNRVRLVTPISCFWEHIFCDVGETVKFYESCFLNFVPRKLRSPETIVKAMFHYDEHCSLKIEKMVILK